MTPQELLDKMKRGEVLTFAELGELVRASRTQEIKEKIMKKQGENVRLNSKQTKLWEAALKAFPDSRIVDV